MASHGGFPAERVGIAIEHGGKNDEAHQSVWKGVVLSESVQLFVPSHGSELPGNPPEVRVRKRYVTVSSGVTRTLRSLGHGL